MSLIVILLIVLLVCAAFGGFGHPRFGYYGWSPLGIALVVILVLLLTGNLR